MKTRLTRMQQRDREIDRARSMIAAGMSTEDVANEMRRHRTTISEWTKGMSRRKSKLVGMVGTQRKPAIATAPTASGSVSARIIPRSRRQTARKMTRDERAEAIRRATELAGRGEMTLTDALRHEGVI